MVTSLRRNVFLQPTNMFLFSSLTQHVTVFVETCRKLIISFPSLLIFFFLFPLKYIHTLRHPIIHTTYSDGISPIYIIIYPMYVSQGAAVSSI